jgi:transcriptional regulator GlxA family with amidase domain
LCDALFVHGVVTAAANEETASSILAAAKDPSIGRALALVHEDPSRDWSAPELASSVGMSRTQFFAKFTELVGEPPARYVARWRVQAAADLMRSRRLSTAEIAERVGYSSEDALARVFRRYLGMTPGQWRRQLDAGTS